MLALAALAALALGLGLWHRARVAEAKSGAASRDDAGGTRSVHSKTPDRNPAQSPAPKSPGATALTLLEVRCPTCKGMGRLPTDKPGQTYTCPVCAGAGMRIRRYLPNLWRPCPTCEGMGTLAIEDDLFRTRNRLSKQTCDTCAGRGLVPVRPPR